MNKLEEVDRPSVGDDDVLIRVRATSVNTPDWITVTGVPYIIRLRFGLCPLQLFRGTGLRGGGSPPREGSSVCSVSHATS